MHDTAGVDARWVWNWHPEPSCIVHLAHSLTSVFAASHHFGTMGLPGFRSSKTNDTPTASDVRKHFESGIEDFLQEDSGSGLGHFWNRKEPLQALFDWGRQIRHEKRKAEEDLNTQVAAYSTQVDQNEKLQKRCKQLSKDKAQLEEELSRASSDLRSINRKHRDEITQIKLLHSTAIGELEKKMRDVQENYEGIIQDQRAHYESTMQDQKAALLGRMDDQEEKHKNEQNDLIKNHKSSMTTLENSHKIERNKLIGQLLVNQEDNQEWPDDKLKARFLELHRLVNSIASPQRLEFKIPPDAQIGPEVDPVGFFPTYARGRSHYLLKAVIWGMLQEHFFHVPFGFGAFGPESIQGGILEAFNMWRSLFQHESNIEPIDNSDLSIFESDRLANKWRSTTFQRVKRIDEGDAEGTESRINLLRVANLATVEARIERYLESVAALSQNRVSEEVKDEIQSGIKLAEEIAIQFGIHSCKIILLRPREGWSGDPAPGLLKYGRDRGNGPSRQTIVHCKGGAED
ncbi:hypothetical protein BCR34DRAFT_611283 [Clohesyomyces aquaticus]|uniref:Uncharacterized protein n=1 Tax=Clohesyomyces aquaticus TaxID=1231657 RepID=A0A1Y2A3D0_9PLEO|nr:hypothetical protein BCR34DRAFT_611283 [Clohesyomyces aquaticus]